MSRDRRNTLSTTQHEAVLMLSRNGGRIERWPGGFWTYPGCVSSTAKGPGWTYRVPVWWVPTQTVRSLLRKGLLVHGEGEILVLSADWDEWLARPVHV